MKTTNLFMSFALVASLFVGVVGAAPEAAAKKDLHRFSLCHATGSAKNPYIKVTVDYHSFTKQGHDQHQDERDIVPAVAKYGYPGKNLHLLSTLENDCKTPDTVEPTQPEQPSQPEQPTKPSRPDQPSQPSKKQHKYTVCHATRSASNPYRVITVDYNSIVKMGHGSHDDLAVASYAEARAVKAAGNHWGDVIPAIPAHDYAGLNYDDDGQALLKNGCKLATSTVTVESDATGAPAETPEENIRLLDEAAFTDEPGFGAVGLPQTGPTNRYTAPALIALAGLMAAGATYLVSHLRRI